jgi:hypothetical protein
MLAVGARPDVLVWRQQSGLFRSYNDPDRLVRVGAPGMSDAAMVVAVTIGPEMVGKTVGVCCMPEFKTTAGRQSEAQRNWQAAVEARGAVYGLVRSADDMLALVAKVQDGSAW